MNKIAELLQAPFAAHEYEWRVSRLTKKEDKVVVLCYVTNRAIQNRLDDVFGPMGWRVEYEAGPLTPNGGVMCTISAYDPDSKQWVSKADGAEKSDIESVKGAYSNACKRAAVAWGIGRLLYKLTETMVPLKEKGQHWVKTANGFKCWDEPQLPAWALAENAGKVDDGAPWVDVSDPAPKHPTAPQPTLPPDGRTKKDLQNVLRTNQWTFARTKEGKAATMALLLALAGTEYAQAAALEGSYQGFLPSSYVKGEQPESQSDPFWGLMCDTVMDCAQQGELPKLFELANQEGQSVA